MKLLRDLKMNFGFAEFYLAGLAVINLLPLQLVFLDPGLYPKFGLLALLNTASCIYLFWKNGGTLKINKVILLYAIFIAVNLLGLVETSFPVLGLLTVFSEIQVLILAVIVGHIIAKNRRQLLPLMFSFITIALSLWGLVQLYGTLDGFVLTHDSTYLVNASLGHRNLYGQFLVLALIGSFLGFPRQFRLGSFAMVMLASTVIILLLSRSTWLVAAVGIIIFLGFEIRKSGIRAVIKRRVGWLVGVASILVLLVWLVDDIYTIEHHFLTLKNYDTGTTMDRFLLVARSFEIGFDNLLFGIGIGDWPIEIMRFDQSGMLTANGSVYYQRAHNDFAQIFADSGVFAVLAYGAVFCLGLVSSFKAAIKTQDRMSVLVFVLWSGLLIVSLTNFPKERPEFAVFLGVLLALTPGSIHFHFSGKGFIMLSMALSLVALAFFSLRMKSEYHLTMALQSQKIGKWVLQKNHLDLVNDDFLPYDYISRPIDWHRGYGRVSVGASEEGRSLFQDALDKNPFHPETLNGLGSVEAAKGEFEAAENYFLQSVKRTPTYQAGQLNLAAIYLVQEKRLKAFNSFIAADPYLVNDRYVEIGTILARDSIRTMLPRFPERKMKLTVEAIYNTPSWSFDVIRHAAMNNKTFPTQLRIEALYFLLKNCEDSECEEVQSLKEKYVPNHKIDLDL
jgi:tetratricopeptide (TPR) repeat protein